MPAGISQELNARFAELKRSIVAELVRQNFEGPREIIPDYIFLDKHGHWYEKWEGWLDYRPVYAGQEGEFIRLLDMHSVDFFTGTHDTWGNHTRAIIMGMEEALARLKLPPA